MLPLLRICALSIFLILYSKCVSHGSSFFRGSHSPCFSHDLSGKIGKRTSHHKHKCNGTTECQQMTLLWACADKTVHVNSLATLRWYPVPPLSLGRGGGGADRAGIWTFFCLWVIRSLGHKSTKLPHDRRDSPTITNYCQKECVKFEHLKTNNHFNCFSYTAWTSMVMLQIFSWTNSIYFHNHLWRSLSGLFNFTDEDIETCKRLMGFRRLWIKVGWHWTNIQVPRISFKSHDSPSERYGLQ